MPRKRELDRLRERARLDPVFAAEWKAKKLAEDKARRDAKLSPEYRAAREWRRAHPKEHRRNIQKAADDRRKEERRAYYASDLGIEKQEELRCRRAKRDAWHLLNPGVLCADCNRRVAFLEQVLYESFMYPEPCDDTWLEKALKYLRKYRLRK